MCDYAVSAPLQAFWKQKGFSGEIVAGSSTGCPFSVTFDATSPSGNAALVGFITGQGASVWSSQEVMSSHCTDSAIQLIIFCIFVRDYLFKNKHVRVARVGQLNLVLSVFINELNIWELS